MNYQNVYDQICFRAKKETNYRIKRKRLGQEYYEGHHIIPKCLGGLGKSNQYYHPNIVLLNAREHFLCHWILHELYKNSNSLLYAFSMMCKVKDKNQLRYIPSSRVIEYCKIQEIQRKKEDREFAKKISLGKKGKPLSETHKKNIGAALKISTKKRKPLSEDTKKNISNSQKGRKLSDDWKKKISESNKGKIRSTEAKLKYSNCKIGKLMGPMSIEQKKKISDSNKGKNKPKIECPYCNKIGGIPQMKQWHFENCKNKL